MNYICRQKTYKTLINIIGIINIIQILNLYQVNASNKTVLFQLKPTVTLPHGCTCQKSGVELSTCSAFNCDCACDLTTDICDLDCCCDEDCLDKEISGFSICSNVDNTNSIWDGLIMCNNSKYFSKVKSKYPMKVEESIENALKDLLCIKTINSPSKGRFFSDTGYPTPSAVFAKNGMAGTNTKHYNYDAVVGGKAVSITEVSQKDTSFYNQSERYFQVGDLISVFVVDENYNSTDGTDEKSFQLMFDGIFRLPSGGDGLSCNDMNFLKFGRNVQNSVCFRAVEQNNLAVHCNTDLSVDYFVSDLFLGTKPDVILPSHINIDDGSVVHISLASFINDRQVRIDIHNDPTPFTFWDEDTGECWNAMETIVYEIIYDDVGKIVDAGAHITTKRVTSTSKVVRQVYSVYFLPTSIKRDVNASNVTVKKSGNPGYIWNAPILSGIYMPKGNESSFDYIKQNSEGMAIMDSGRNGRCDSVSMNGTIIRFGEDIMVGCRHQMSRTELEDLCTAKVPNKLLAAVSMMDPSKSMVVPYWLIPTHNMIGIFGNADFKNIGQWLHLHSPMTNPEYSIKDRAWFSKESRCESFPSRVQYKFLWTKTGNTNHPQNKIISAQVEFDNSRSMRHILRPIEKQNYFFAATVSWIQLDTNVEDIIPSPPSLFPKLPDDMFYPFVLGIKSDARSTSIQYTSINCFFFLFTTSYYLIITL